MNIQSVAGQETHAKRQISQICKTNKPNSKFVFLIASKCAPRYPFLTQKTNFEDKRQIMNTCQHQRQILILAKKPPKDKFVSNKKQNSESKF